MENEPSQKERYSHLGDVVIATHVVTSEFSPRRIRKIILLLAACVALMMTGAGIIMPVFARRFSEFGSGVEALGLMTMAFALAQFVASPFMGSLADRWGRRPLVLLSLAAFMTANIGFLLASSTAVFIVIRALGGALTAGLFPASMSIVADIVPEDRRARWIGIVMGSYGVGFICGPILGGILYDGWGFEAPFLASAIMALLGLMAAFFVVPETRSREVRQREALRKRRTKATEPVQNNSLWSALPKPLYVFGILLFLDFIAVFAFAFVEPQMIFYMYEELGWSTTQFGFVVGMYGLIMVLGQTVLGQLSDTFGRKPLILIGTLLTIIFYIGIAMVTSFGIILVVAAVAGLGEALTAPARSAFYFDITAEQHRSKIVGLKGSAASLGGVAGPLLLVLASRVMTPQEIFLSAAALWGIGAALTLLALKEPYHILKASKDMTWEVASQRNLAAQSVLRGIVLRATTARISRNI